MKMKYFKFHYYIEGIKMSSRLSESDIRNRTRLYVKCKSTLTSHIPSPHYEDGMKSL